MVINIRIHESVKNYSCHSAFNEKNISIFDVLTFITHKKVSKCGKTMCAKIG